MLNQKILAIVLGSGEGRRLTRDRAKPAVSFDADATVKTLPVPIADRNTIIDADGCIGFRPMAASHNQISTGSDFITVFQERADTTMGRYL